MDTPFSTVEVRLPKFDDLHAATGDRERMEAETQLRREPSQRSSCCNELQEAVRNWHNVAVKLQGGK